MNAAVSAAGRDQYGGGVRMLTAERDGAMILLEAEGSGSGGGQLLLTPDQAYRFGANLAGLGLAVSEQVREADA